MKIYKITTFGLLFALSACNSSQDAANNSETTVTEGQEIITEDSTVIEEIITENISSIDDAFAMIISAFKSDEDEKWAAFDSKYIDPNVGVFEIYLDPEGYNAFENGDGMGQMDGGNGPGPDAFADLRDKIRAAKESQLILTPMTKLNANDCEVKKKTCASIQLDGSDGLLENNSQTAYNTPSDEELKTYADLDTDMCAKIVMDVYNDNDGTRRLAVFYFKQVDGAYFLTAVSLGFDCNFEN